MAAATGTVTSKGQITIPKTIREALDIRPGDQMFFLVEGKRAILTPVRSRPLNELYGALPATKPYPGSEAIRSEIREKLGQRLARDDEG
jgi:AbrB family looped-hinge helix DNA binding protein